MAATNARNPGSRGVVARGIFVAIMVGAVLMGGSGGCARRRQGRGLFGLREAPVKLHATEPRVDAVQGRLLVMPVALDGPAPSKSLLPAKLDDGRKVEASLHWVSVVPEDSPGTWLPSPGNWSATPASAGSRPPGVGSWVVMAELPIDAMGQGLTVGGQRVRPNWLPDPSLIRPMAGEGPWARPLPEPIPPGLVRLAAAAEMSPASRWRHKLLLRGLDPERSGPGALPAHAMDHPVLEALADQTEARWQVGIAMLWAADADLCARVKRRLVAVADCGGGVVTPMWPTGQAELDALLMDLLDQRLEPAQRAERAAAWLEAQPAAVAWIADDAGLRDAQTERNLAACVIANLGEHRTLAWAQVRGVPEASPELAPLPAGGSRALAVVAPPGPAKGESPRTGGVTIEAHAGKWSGTLVAAMDRLAATPPGLRIDGFRTDWNLPAFLAAGGASSGVDAAMAGDPAWATAALLHRTAEASAESGDSRWSLFVECHRPPDSPAGADETVRIWLGPTGSPSAVLKASSSGVVIDEAAGGRGSIVRGAAVRREAGQWVAQVPIPARCIEQDGTLRIAVERVDALGRRTSWPRPVLPWQTEPGRVAADLSTWGDASAAR